MWTPEEFSGSESNYYTPYFFTEDGNSSVCDSLLSGTGSSNPPPAPYSHSQDFISLDDLGVDAISTLQSEFDDDEFLNKMKWLWTFNDPTATPTMSLPSLSTIKEAYDSSYTRDDDCMVIPEKVRASSEVGDDLSEQQYSVVECPADEDAILSTRVAKKRKLSLGKRHQMIEVEDLKRHFDKTREEAAKIFKVSVPTLKRRCRKYGIPRWPFNNKKNRVLPAKSVDEELEGLFDQITSSSYLVVAPVSAMQPEPETTQMPKSEIPTPPRQLSTETVAKQEEKTMIVKVKYQNDFVKFEISSASKLADLEGEIANRLKLRVGSFDIKYVDDEEDLVLIRKDEDLWLCMRSVGMKTIKMVVLP